MQQLENTMPEERTKLTRSLKQLGEIQVNEWDFMGLMNKDIKEINLSRSLRRLGNIQVMEWDFRTVLPTVNKLAHQEVDLVDIFRRTACYRVTEWDFRSAFASQGKLDGRVENRLSTVKMQNLIVTMKNFLQYVTLNLIDEPNHAQIKVREIAPNVLRFKLILAKRDVAMLIGREGHTASAIRNILKTNAGMSGVQALLQIHSHEEEMAHIHDPHGEGHD